MTKNQEPSRREFLSGSGALVLGEALLSLAGTSAAAIPREPQSSSQHLVTKSQLKVGNSTLAPTFTRNYRPARSGTRCWTTSSGRR